RACISEQHVAARNGGAGCGSACPRLLDLHLGQRRAGCKQQYPKQVFHLRSSSSWSFLQNIFPVAVLGSASTNSTNRGALKAAILPRAQSMISAASVLPRAPALSTTTAFTVSPRCGSLAAMTQASSMSGCAYSIASTSAGQTLKPEQL